QKLLKEAPTIPGYTFATRFEAATEISGDFYEFILLSDGRIGFAQGDVSGHGMQAGLIMSMAKKVLAIYARQGARPAQVLSSVNDALAEDLGGKMFVTITYAILDPDERTITWARAGHSPPVRFNPHSGELSEINPAGMVVGMKSGPLFQQAVQEEVTQLRSGDIFLIYTDGITETMNRQGEEYDTERLFELIKTHGPTVGVEGMLDRILDSIRSFRGSAPADDDITMLALAVD
ncbi:MAG: PP2C family protein-serine/threonine phosphatase, partial [Planctomycetota bacterium]|nr:PP2C family protein-serine/threonine phosphatase [Planctomycetota bacterium]